MASATDGSAIVTIRPTMTRLPDPGEVALAAALGAGEPPAAEVDGDGEPALLGPQPVAATTTTSAAGSRARSHVRRRACGKVMGAVPQGEGRGRPREAARDSGPWTIETSTS